MLPELNRKKNWRYMTELNAVEANGATASPKALSDSNTYGTSSAGTPLPRTATPTAPLEFSSYW
jgi:hypothetical protein